MKREALRAREWLEYLQFTLYILATVWLLQRGSPESKEIGTEGREPDKRQKVGRHADSRSPRWARAGGLRTMLFSNSPGRPARTVPRSPMDRFPPIREDAPARVA